MPDRQDSNMSRFSRLALSLALACSAFALQAQEPYRPIEQRFTAEQLRATGLDQLNAEQLRALNALLRDEQTAQVSAVREETERKVQKSGSSGFFDREREPVVSRIDGEFGGWSAGTRFRLANGQTWRVLDTPDYYVPKSKATTAPAVVLAPGLLGGWYMQFEGHGPRAKVQQVD
jgi:hypothetical protein